MHRSSHCGVVSFGYEVYARSVVVALLNNKPKSEQELDSQPQSVTTA